MFKKILLFLFVSFVIIQFFRIDMNNPKVDEKNDFIAITSPNHEVESLLRRACYDCHSNETVYPWYAQIAPISWWLKNHIDEGREHLNFSEWGTYKQKRADHKLEECAEEVAEGEMPLDSYTWTHSDADLNADQKKMLKDFFNGLRTSGEGENEQEHEDDDHDDD